VRTAPYFVHLAAGLHALAAGKLTITGVMNLTLVASVLGGATSAYVGIRMLAPQGRIAAALLASLYVLCPAIVVILTSMDMYATIMALPWLPNFWLGVAGTLMPGNDARPLMLATGAAAPAWYGHPAVAAWITPLWVAALALCLVFVNRSWTQAGRALIALGALAGS